MRVLVSHEESQAVCKAFRELGHEAWSNDILPCSGGHPEWHIQGDAKAQLCYSNLKTIAIQGKSVRWDLVISFPPCTDLAVSGARWFQKKRLSGEQEKSIDHFLNTWYYSHCTENPIGIMNDGKYLKKWFPALYEKARANWFPFRPTQIIQPWQFGHGETKATCLWLRNLPPLKPTNIVSGREQKIWKMPPGPERAKMRSKTFPGIAAGMAVQWGGLINNTYDNII
jgi:hypothetical protein